MKIKNLAILITLISIALSCNEKKTTKEIIDKYSFEEINQIYKYKLDTTLQIPTELEDLAKVEQDTIVKTMKAIYGNDDRKDFYQEVDSNKIKNSYGVVALVNQSDLEPIAGNSFELLTIPFFKAKNLCPKERFELQPTAAFCSGFAVSNNIIITAGHCIKTPEDLQNVRFIFDFKASDSLNSQTTFERKLILTGKKIRTFQDNAKGIDYAIIQVNEKIPTNRILSLEEGNKIRNKQEIYVIGHPVGLPVKISGRAFVRENSHPLYFTGNLDTYGGNSGSPVFNANTHKVEGILVRGETDFRQINGCFVSMPCPDLGCRGEDVSRTSQFISSLKSFY